MSIRQINLLLHHFDEVVTPGEHQILVRLADRADHDGGGIYPCADMLAARCRLKPAYVDVALRRLRRRGLLSTDADGRWRLTLDASAERSVGSVDDLHDPDPRSVGSASAISTIVGPATEAPSCAPLAGAHDRAPSFCTSLSPRTYARSPEVLPTEGVRARSDGGGTEEPRARLPLAEKARPAGIWFPGTCGVPLQRFLVDREFVPALINELGVPPAQAEMRLLEWCRQIDLQQRGVVTGSSDPLTWWRQAFSAWRGRPVGITRTRSTVGERNREWLLNRRAQRGQA